MSAGRQRSRRPQRTARVLRPIAGQCFEIDVRYVDGQWVIRVPEIDDVTHASRRGAVESAARECIAARTGIPVGYVSVWVRD